MGGRQLLKVNKQHVTRLLGTEWGQNISVWLFEFTIRNYKKNIELIMFQLNNLM